MILKSIIKSQRIIVIGNNTAINNVMVSVIPKFSDKGVKGVHKSLETFKNLRITQVKWNKSATLGFTLSDGQSCKAGKLDFKRTHNFNPTKKIT